MCTAVSGRNVNKATPGLRSSCVFVYNSSRVSVVLFMGVSVNVCDIFNSLNFELSSIEFFYNQPPPLLPPKPPKMCTSKQTARIKMHLRLAINNIISVNTNP